MIAVAPLLLDANVVKGEERKLAQKIEETPSTIQVVNGVVRTLAYFIGFTPWIVLFLSAWEGSIIPGSVSEEIWGKKSPAKPFTGSLQYVVLLGAVSAWMSMVMWAAEYPVKSMWDTFPTFCVKPRSFFGLIAIHQAPMYHLDYDYFSYCHFLMWLVGATLLTHGRRAFVWATICISFVGHAIFWFVGDSAVCVAGFEPVIYGWWAVLIPGAMLSLRAKCPPTCGYFFHCFVVFVISGVLVQRFWEQLSANAKPGQSMTMNICGFGSGLAFGLMLFFSERYLGIALGTFPNFEKKARDIGYPWPGWCEFVIQLFGLLCFGCRACKRCFKKATNDEDWFEW